MKSPFRRPRAAPDAAPTAAEAPVALTPEAELHAASAAADDAAAALARAMERRKAALAAIARQGGPRAQLAKRAASFETATAAAWRHGFAQFFGLWHVGWRDRRSFSDQARALVGPSPRLPAKEQDHAAV